MNFITKVHNLLTKEYCDKFLNKFESLNLTPEVKPYNLGGLQEEFKLINLNEDLEEFNTEILRLVDLEVQKYLKPFIGVTGVEYELQNSSIVRLKVNTRLPLHSDSEFYMGEKPTRRHFAILLYLQEMEGGELYFPIQKELVGIDPGLLLIFPTFMTHPHTVFPCTNKDRYTYRVEYIIKE